MTILLLTLALFLVYLVYERIVLNRLRKAIPMVVSVTGTRGKSSVVRMLASVLRESGRTVLAKTTGSQAQFVLPDGTVRDVPRRGIASILEQKKVLRKAAELHADYLVVEIMSIHPENHVVESHQILKPNIVVLTNIRPDHTDAMGETEEEIARVLSLDISAGAKVYVPREMWDQLTPSIAQVPRVTPVSVARGTSNPLFRQNPNLQKKEFAENLDLVASVARDFGIDDATIAKGILGATQDIGKFRVWTYRAGGKEVLLVNAFAANDPESTMRVMEKAREMITAGSTAFIGLLNLRSDRGDRTQQWIEALSNGLAGHFKRIYVIGEHANVVRRKVKGVEVIKRMRPEEMTNSIVSDIEEGGVLFGFGNIGGAGQRLVGHWQRVGEEYGV